MLLYLVTQIRIAVKLDNKATKMFFAGMDIDCGKQANDVLLVLSELS